MLLCVTTAGESDPDRLNGSLVPGRPRGARDGAVVRALASDQCGPGSNPGVDAICGLNLLLVPSFAPRGFSPGTPVFPCPQKPSFPISNSTRNQVDEEPLCGCATSKSLFTYLFIHLFISCDVTCQACWENSRSVPSLLLLLG